MISCILVRGFVTPNQNVKLNAPFYPILVPCPSIHPISPISLPSRLRYFHASNEHHKWLKKRDWPAVQNVMRDSDRELDLLRRKYKERDEHGRLPHHWLAAKAQTHTHTLAHVGVCGQFATIKAKLSTTLP